MMSARGRGRDDTGRTKRLHHLPSLSPPPWRKPGPNPPQPPSNVAVHAAHIRDEALYLASILRARLSDSARGGDGRGLLSRALARGELDQFLVAFFSDPSNLLFAREKVEARRIKIAKISAKRSVLHRSSGQRDSTKHGGSQFSVHAEGSVSNSSSALSPELSHGSDVRRCTDSGRFGPVLADSAGNFNFLPISSQDDVATNMAVLFTQGDEVPEAGSTSSCPLWEHKVDGNRHKQSHCGLPHQQRQVDDGGSEQSGGASLTTVQGENGRGDYFPYCDTMGAKGSAAVSDRTDRHNQRRKGESQRHESECASGNVVPAVESIHFEGHLLHRVCGVTGKLPAHGSGDGGTSDCVEDTHDSDESSLLEDTGQNQLARLRRNPRMMDIISKLKVLSMSFMGPGGHGTDPGSSNQDESQRSQQKRKAEVTVGGKRVEAIQLAQQEYLRLFEGMLGELLKIQREKSKAFRAEKLALRTELERAREAAAVTRGEAEVHAIQLEALLAVKKALATEVATQQGQLVEMTTEMEARVRMERESKQEHFAADAKKNAFLDELKEEELKFRTRFKEVEVEATKAEMGMRSMKHLAEKVDRTAAINKQIYRVDETKYKLIQESNESWCQTTVNDDGLWDYQDGLTRQVSRNIYLRLRWQALRRFASCPSCHGLGPFTTVNTKADKSKRILVPGKDRAAEDPTLEHQHLQHKRGKRKRGNADPGWAMPNVLVEFMCHLPKTAKALPIKSLRWLTRQAQSVVCLRSVSHREIWLILDERQRVDAIDTQEGQATQDMNDFMVELFLRRHSLRQDAELQLYIFLVSLKAHYKKSVAAHTFARLMDLLNEKDPTPSGGNSNSGNGIDGHTSAVGHDHESTTAKGKPPKKDREKEHYMREEEILEAEVQPHRSPLSSAFIPVLLFARRVLLKRKKVDLDVLRREQARKRFASAISKVRLQETARRNFQGSSPLALRDLTTPSGSHQDGAVPVVDEGSLASASDGEKGGRQAERKGGSGPSSRKDVQTVQAGRAVHADDEVAKVDGVNEPNGVDGADQVDAMPAVRGGARSVVVCGEGLLPGTGTKRKTHNTESTLGAAAAAAAAAATTATPSTAMATAPAMSASARNHGGNGGGLAERTKSGAAMMGTKKKTSARLVVKAHAGHGGHGNATQVSNGSGQENCLHTSDGKGIDAKAEHQQDELLADGGPGVEAIDLPDHVLTEDNCTFWVSLEMAVRVLTVVLHWCTPMKRHAYMRSIERSAALLTSRGHITGVEASHSFIRSSMRKTIAAVESEIHGSPDGVSSVGVTETLGGIRGAFEEGCGVGGVVSGDAALHDARIVIDMDKVIELVMEVVLLRQNSIEHKLRALFSEGDANGDGVLSFEEFTSIVCRAAPHFSERRVLRMFREALTSGTEGSFAIEKDTFCNVCRQHGLVQLIDIAHLEKAGESGPAGAARDRFRHGGAGVSLHRGATETVTTAALQHHQQPTVTASRVVRSEHAAPTFVSEVPQSEYDDVTQGVAETMDGVQEEENGKELGTSIHVEGDLDDIERVSGDASDDGSQRRSDCGLGDG
ncbi:unnamed protein product [Scytosiphon promiscuus]